MIVWRFWHVGCVPRWKIRVPTSSDYFFNYLPRKLMGAQTFRRRRNFRNSKKINNSLKLDRITTLTCGSYSPMKNTRPYVFRSFVHLFSSKCCDNLCSSAANFSTSISTVSVLHVTSSNLLGWQIWRVSRIPHEKIQLPMSSEYFSCLYFRISVTTQTFTAWE